MHIFVSNCQLPFVKGFVCKQVALKLLLALDVPLFQALGIKQWATNMDIKNK